MGYLESETDQAYSFFVLFQLYTGLRFGECAALQWRDVDMTNNVVHVRHSMNKVKGKDVLGDPKAQYSVREVPLNKKAMDVLMREKARVSSDKTPAFDGDCFVFPGDISGSATERGSLNRYIKEACRQISQTGNKDFPVLTSHDMRHTFTIRAIENGMSMQTLKSILG